MSRSWFVCFKISMENADTYESDSKTWCVYVHTTPSGKKYVGCTSRTPKARWENGSGYLSQMFGRAIRKYGWENIQHEIIYSGLSHDDAMLREQQLIKQYQTNNPLFGYNLTCGGEGMEGYIASDETKAKMSSNRQGINAHHFGKPMTENAKHIVSAKLKNKNISDATRSLMSDRKKKTVYQYTTDGILVNSFSSAMEASLASHINHGNLCACCRHVKQQAGGYFWSYSPIDDPQIIVDHVQGISPLPPIYSRNERPVNQYDHDLSFVQSFASIELAADATGIPPQQIMHCCKHHNAVSGMYKWRYADE